MTEIRVTEYIDPDSNKHHLRNWNQFVRSVLILIGANILQTYGQQLKNIALL